jgi:hypothetical protein
MNRSGQTEDTATILALLTDDLTRENERTVAAALHALADYCHTEKSQNAIANQQVIFQNGGHLAILQVLRRYFDTAEVQVYGICAIMNLTSGSGQGKNLFVRIGGIETILTSMKSNLSDAIVQRRGCGALSNIILDSEANAVLLDQDDGIPTIVAAMRTFPDDARVQFYACRVLYKLCSWRECEAHILAARGVSAIAEALENHGYDEDVGILARRLLGHFAQSTVVAERQFVDV